MYALGYRPAMIQRIALGANADGTLDAITHDAVTVTSQYEGFTNRAEWLEWKAGFAIDYAIASVEQARLAVLDAVDGRLEAEEAKQA
jgi:hypothetical protein